MAFRPMGFTNLANNLVNSYMMGKEYQAKQAQAEEDALIRSLMGSALTGTATPEQMQELATTSPQQFLGVQNYLTQQESAKHKTAADLQLEEDRAEATKLLVMDDEGVQSYLQGMINDNSPDAEEAQFMLTLKPDQRRSFIEMQAKDLGVDVPESSFEQGQGDMSGYTFNNRTGTYTIDPILQRQLEADAAAKAAEEGILKGKDLAGVNDKVTGLTKGVQEIYESAKSLEALEGKGSPAAQLAAVFKFMKANDPTSTVREGEQGQVYAAEGAMKGFAAKLNQLVGRGGLSEENFRDLVDTAKTLANSAVESADWQVSAYLKVLEDSLTQKDYNNMMARVPELFVITEMETQDEVTPNLTETEVDAFLNQFKAP